MIEWLLLLLPVASLSGWYIGKKSQPSVQPIPSSNSCQYDYLLGLKYLISEQPDKAVDIFIKLLTVDRDTIDTHLALGNLFRRRGEVDRAIRIHQNIVTKPQLAQSQRTQALQELAQDYLRAGVLDQAERLFLELVESGYEEIPSLHFLLNIYQQQKDWIQAIKIGSLLQEKTKEPMQTILAHFYCELAQRDRLNNELVSSRQHLHQALTHDKNCVRASLALAECATVSGDYFQAINHYKHVPLQDPDYLSETIVPLRFCYDKLQQEEEFIEYLRTHLQQFPRIAIVIALSDYIERSQGSKAAINFLADRIRQTPSLRGLDRLIELYLSISDPDTREKLCLLKDLVATLLVDKPNYRCTECGFSAANLYWSCPGCQHWSTVRPVQDINSL